MTTPLADRQSVALTDAEVAAIPTSIARVTAIADGDTWTWTDPDGHRRSIPSAWALPRIMGEHHVRYLDGGDLRRGFIVLLPPAAA